MPNEYYDRDLPRERRLPASNSQQDSYDVARSRFTAAISRNLEDICASNTEIAEAYEAFKTLLQVNPTREFKVFRPEDASMTQDAASQLAFLR